MFAAGDAARPDGSDLAYEEQAGDRDIRGISIAQSTRRLPGPEVQVKRVVRFLSLIAVAAAAMAMPRDAFAQRRVVRRPAPRSVVVVSARPYYRPYYYRPYYYAPAFAFGGYAGWYGGWYGYPYGYPYSYAQFPYPYGRYTRDYSSSARLQVEPRHAEVFIDGYFVGTVDDFDGWLQRLHVEPGEHELQIFLRGHRSYRQSVLFRPGATLKIEHVMQPLAAGEAEDPRPVPSGNRRVPARRGPQDDPRDYPPGQDHPPAPESPRQPGDPVPSSRRDPTEPARSTESQQYGSLALRVQPLDAEVIVDGESWQSPQAGSITLQLSDGPHRVEVRKPGYRPYSSEVRVRRGESTSLNVSLSKE